MLNALNARRNFKIQLPNLEIAATEWGNPTGNPIIALHGWLDNIASYYPLLMQSNWLLQNDLRFIAFDLPGHGHSEHRHLSHPYNLVEYVQDLHDLVEALQLNEFSLLGHSLGAAIASIFAATFPQRVSNLILIEGVGPLTQTEEEGPAQLAKSILQRNRHYNRDNQYYEDLQLIIHARAKVSDLDEQNVALLVERNMRSTNQGYHWRSDPRLRLPTALYLTPKQAQAFNKNLSMPTILLYGKNGFVHKYPAVKERIADYKQLQIRELDGGHHLHMQYPEQVIETIVPFLKANS